MAASLQSASGEEPLPTVSEEQTVEYEYRDIAVIAVNPTERAEQAFDC